MAAPLLTLAGRKRTSSSWTGGAIVQLQADGTWTELKAGGTIYWNLQSFINDTTHILFCIEAGGLQSFNTPYWGTLYRSTDQGATWTDVTPSSGSTEYVNDVAQDVNGDFWCITDVRQNITVLTGGPSRIYKSTDNGATWTLSYSIPEYSFGYPVPARYYPAFNITCHPTDANIILVEGTEMVAWASRLWRTTDGGSNWSAAITPTFPSEVSGAFNIAGAKMHVFDYTSTGRLVYAGIFELANNKLFIIKSSDNGDSFSLYHTEAEVAGYGAHFQEETLLYLLHPDDFFQAPLIFDAAPTKIADNTDSPFTTSHYFHGISRHIIGSDDTLHVGCYVASPGSGATDDASVFTRPADLGSGWSEHAQWDSMDSDLGYRLYVAIHGLVGATAYVPEVARPPRPVSPPDIPGGPGAPGGEPAIGIAEPGVGIAEPPTGIREKRRSQEAPMRLRRRQEILPPEEQVLPPRAPPFLMGDRIDKHQPISLVSPSPKIDKWLSFGWLTPAVLAGQKTLSLRDWGPVEAYSWKRAQLAYAYDDAPSKGGNRVALLRISHTPYKRLTNKLRNSEFYASGLMYAQSMGLRHPKGLTPEQIWSKIKESSVELWVVRYRVEQIYDQLSPTRGQVRVGY